MRIKPGTFAFLLMVAAAACGNDDEPIGPTPTSLVVEPSTIRLLIESSIQVEAQVVDQTGEPITDAPLTFRASQGAPFTVSAEGEVSAGDTPGTGVLIVESGDLAEDVPVEVFGPGHPVGVIAGTTQTGGEPAHAAISVNGDVLVGAFSAGMFRGRLPSFGLTSVDPPLSSHIAEAFSPRGTRVFIARNPGSTTVSVREPSTLAVVETASLPVGGFVFDIASGEEEEIVYISTDDGYVGKVDIANNSATLIGSAGIMTIVGPIIRRPGSSVVYAVMFQGVIELDPADSGERTLEVGGNPSQLAVGRNDRVVYAANGTNAVQVADFSSLSVASIDLGCNGYGLVLTPDGARLYASCSSTGEVKIVDVPSRTVVETLNVGGAPQRLAVSPDGSTVVVPNRSGYVTFIQ